MKSITAITLWMVVLYFEDGSCISLLRANNLIFDHPYVLVVLAEEGIINFYKPTLWSAVTYLVAVAPGIHTSALFEVVGRRSGRSVGLANEASSSS